MTAKKTKKEESYVVCGDCGKRHPEGTVKCDCGYEL
jgi:ribosomal protein L32